MVRTNEPEQVNTEEKISRIKVYPIPSQGLVYVDMPESDNVGIMATDMAGKIVHKKGFCEGRRHSDLLF